MGRNMNGDDCRDVMMVVLLVLLLGLQPHTVCKTNARICTAYDPLPVSHQFYQPNDLVVGEIATQVFYFHDHNPSFNEEPTQSLIEESV